MCAVMNMPPTPRLRAYQQHKTAICDTTNFVVGKSLSDAAKRVRNSLGANDTDTINIAVSFDGTWSKQCFTANYGIGVVIAVETGVVLDYAVMSKSCEKCKAAEKLQGDLQAMECKPCKPRRMPKITLYCSHPKKDRQKSN